MDDELRDNLIRSGRDARYDECAKKLLSDKRILAWILKNSAVEYENCTIDEIVGYIEDTPEISSVAVDAGETAQSVKGSANEDIVLNEGKITYDLRFEALAPGTDGELIQLIINIEAQNAFKPNYPLLKRAVYYCSRMISAQKGMEFFNSEYNKIKKVYSIWVCTNPPETHKDTITRYRISEENIIGSVSEDRQHYDLMNIVMLCLGENQKSERNALGMLETLFSTEDNIKDKIEILDKTFDLKMTHELETEVSEMCNLSEGVYAKGLDKGLAQGMDKGMALGMDKGMALGMDRSLLESIRNIKQSLNISTEKAMDILKVPVDKRADFERQLGQ